MNRLFVVWAALAVSCAADTGNLGGQNQSLTGAAEAVEARPLSSTIPTRWLPKEKAEELSAALSSLQEETTAESLARSYSYLQEIGEPSCAWTDRCGSAGGQYSGCVFGFCAWCQTYALCHFEDGSPNFNEFALCDPGPCKKP